MQIRGVLNGERKHAELFLFCVPEKFLRSAAALRNDRDQLDFNATARVKPLRNLCVLKQHEVMSAAAPAEGKWSGEIQAGDGHFLPPGLESWTRARWSKK